MEKAITSSLAIAIFMSSAAAEPVQMSDKELELIHGGTDPLIRYALLNKPDGSTVLIHNGVEYKIMGSTIFLPNGTQVQATHNSNGSTTLVTSDGLNINLDHIPSIAAVGDGANANAVISSGARIGVEVR